LGEQKVVGIFVDQIMTLLCGGVLAGPRNKWIERTAGRGLTHYELFATSASTGEKQAYSGKYISHNLEQEVL
jgi:hypothetical protein